MVSGDGACDGGGDPPLEATCASADGGMNPPPHHWLWHPRRRELGVVGGSDHGSHARDGGGSGSSGGRAVSGSDHSGGNLQVSLIRQPPPHPPLAQ